MVNKFDYNDNDDGDEDDNGSDSLSSTEEEMNRIWDKLEASAVALARTQQHHNISLQQNHHSITIATPGGDTCSIGTTNNIINSDEGNCPVLPFLDVVNEKCPPATETPSSPLRSEVGTQFRDCKHENTDKYAVPKQNLPSTTQHTHDKQSTKARSAREDGALIASKAASEKTAVPVKQGKTQTSKNQYLASSTKHQAIHATHATPTLQQKNQTIQHLDMAVMKSYMNSSSSGGSSTQASPSKTFVNGDDKKTSNRHLNVQTDEKNSNHYDKNSDDDDDTIDDRSTTNSASGSSSNCDAYSCDSTGSSSCSSYFRTITTSSSTRKKAKTEHLTKIKKFKPAAPCPTELVDLTTTESNHYGGSQTTKDNVQSGSSSDRQGINQVRHLQVNMVSQTTPLQSGAEQEEKTTVTTTIPVYGQNTDGQLNARRSEPNNADTQYAFFHPNTKTSGNIEREKDRKIRKDGRTTDKSSDHNQTNKESEKLMGGHLDAITTDTTPSPLPIHEYLNPSETVEAMHEAEIDTALCEPPHYRNRPIPILHRFNSQQFPQESRETMDVSEAFPEPMSLLWKSKYDRFNPCQTAVSEVLCTTDDNILISAPTGAGKTALFEMAMCRFISIDISAQQQKAKMQNPNFPIKSLSKARKIVYVAPTKALCEERYNDWSRRFAALNIGIQIVMINGDGESGSSFPDLQTAHLVLTTPEKWDAMTRRWNENFYIFASCKLFLIDEVHTIGDETRGWCLESIITRMKSIHRAAAKIICSSDDIARSSYPDTNQEALQSAFRFVAVSATLPNILEVADALEAPAAYSFDDTYRPVPLRKIVQGMGKVYKNEWKFYNSLCQHVPEIIQRFSHGKQSLIFCHSKKETQRVADLLVEKYAPNKGRSGHSTAPRGSIQFYIDNAVGFHHAGLDKDDRKMVEEAFAAGRIRCLAATSTLAVGVNLPAHLVVIVGSKAYRGGSGYTAIDTSSILQMVGRAGRPGLDSSGIAVLLTDNDSKQSIEHTLQYGLQRAQSMLAPRLAELLNSEVSQGVIKSAGSAKRWLQTTFYFSCKKKEQDAVAATRQLCNDALDKLTNLGLIEQGENQTLLPKPGCHVMNQHSVSYEEMASIVSWPDDVDTRQILISLSKLIDVPVRRNEKIELKDVHKTDVVKFKLSSQLSKFTVKTGAEKTFILLQCIIGRHEFNNPVLRQEMTSISNSAIRILEAADTYSVLHSRNGKLALECFKLARSIFLCMWGIDSGVLNVIPGVGSYTTGRLRLSSISSFQDVLKSQEQTIETAAGRPAPFGSDLKKKVADLYRDRLKFSAELECTRNSNTPSSLICHVLNYDSNRSTQTNGESTMTFRLLAYADMSSNGSLILSKERLDGPGTHKVNLPPSPIFKKITVHLLGTTIGFDQSATLCVGPNEQSQPDEGAALKSNRIERVACGQTGRKRIREVGGQSLTMKRPKTSERPSAVQTAPLKDNVQRPSAQATKMDRSRYEHFDSSKDPQQGSTAEHCPQQRSTQLTHFAQSEQNSNRQNSSTMAMMGTQPPQPLFPTRYYETPVRTRNPPLSSATFRQGNVKANLGTVLTREQQTRWKKTRNQQGLSQQRAFANRRDNPFSFFSHDPNGMESHLEHLSQSQTSQSPKRTFQTDQTHSASNQLGVFREKQHVSSIRFIRNAHGSRNMPSRWNTGNDRRNSAYTFEGSVFVSQQHPSSGIKLLQEKYDEHGYHPGGMPTGVPRTVFPVDGALQRMRNQQHHHTHSSLQGYQQLHPSQYGVYQDHCTRNSPSFYQQEEPSPLNYGPIQVSYTQQKQEMNSSPYFDRLPWYPTIDADTMPVPAPDPFQDQIYQDDGQEFSGSFVSTSPFPNGGGVSRPPATGQEDSPVANFMDIF